jgi:hypothetical protein
MVDKNLIAKRKRVYGDNIEAIADVWSEYLDTDISTVDVCYLMALMKGVRIKATEAILEKEVSKGDETISEFMKELTDSLEDSKTDTANYEYIADNFEWYKGIK